MGAMIRRVPNIGTVLLVLAALSGAAQAQDDMTFTTDDTAAGAAPSGGDAAPAGGDTAAPAGDDGGMSFDVIDTKKEAAAAKKAAAEENDLIRVIQRRPFLQAHRVELAPFMGTNVNDSLVKAFMAGGTLNYYITEYLGIGIHGAYALGTESDLFDKVLDDYDLFPQVSKPKWVGELQFQYDPIYGKFTLFDSWIVPWDIYTLLGAGYTKTELSGHVTLAAGLGQRFYMNHWFTLNLELRDHIYNENYPAGSELVNNLVFTAGVGFFLPPSFEYQTLK